MYMQKHPADMDAPFQKNGTATVHVPEQKEWRFSLPCKQLQIPLRRFCLMDENLMLPISTSYRKIALYCWWQTLSMHKYTITYEVQYNTEYRNIQYKIKREHLTATETSEEKQMNLI